MNIDKKKINKLHGNITELELQRSKMSYVEVQMKNYK